MIRRLRRDDGFTFVELLAASVLSLGALALAGWMLLAALYGGRDVGASGAMTSQAQLFATSVRNGIGSGTDAALANFAGGGQILKATVGEFDDAGALVGSWSCAYWVVTDDGRGYSLRSASLEPVPVSQDAGDFDDWTLLATGLEQVAGERILSLSAAGVVGIKARSDAEGGSPAYVETAVAERVLPQDPGAFAC